MHPRFLVGKKMLLGYMQVSKSDGTVYFEISGTNKRIGKFMRKGEIVVPIVYAVARQMLKQKDGGEAENQVKDEEQQRSQKYHHQDASIFGHGVHICPGRDLALKELTHLPAKILLHFELVTDETKFKHRPKITNQAEPFLISVKPRLRD